MFYYTNTINLKFNPLLLNKFFFLKRAPKIGGLFVNISNFKDNDILFINTLIEEIICIKPILKDSGFVYDNLGNKVFSSYLQLNISNISIIYNFIYYFYFLSKNLKLRRFFFKKLCSNKFFGIFSTFDINFYLFRDLFSFVAYSFVFHLYLKDYKGTFFNNLLLTFHFFKNIGLF